MNELIEFIKLSIISLKQDMEKINLSYNLEFYARCQDRIDTMEYILSVATDIMNRQERENNEQA